MCDLCSAVPKELEMARKETLFEAEQLKQLAEQFQKLANGIIQPHGEEAKVIGIKARQVIKFLAEDWL